MVSGVEYKPRKEIVMASSLQWEAPKKLSFDGNVSENFRKFEEHWNLFEKTELKSSQLKRNAVTFC